MAPVKLFLRAEDGAVESVWAEPLASVGDGRGDAAKGLYRLVSVPFFTTRPTFGDVVAAELDEDGALVYRRVHEPGGYRVTGLWYAKAATFKPLVAWLREAHGAKCEGVIGATRRRAGFVVAALPRGARLARVVAEAKAKFEDVRDDEDHHHDPPPQLLDAATDALHAAIAAGDLGGVKRALREGADLRLPVGDVGAPAIVAAAHGGTAAIVRALLAAGASAKASDDRGETAVFAAARRGDLPILRALLKAGGKAHAHTRAGQSPLYVACAGGHLGVVRALLEAGAKVNDARALNKATPLHVAAMRDRGAVATALIAAGARPAAKDADDFTPLMDAAMRGHAGAARALVDLAKRGDLDASLRLAAAKGFLAVVRLLVARGASPTRPSAKGNTAIGLATQKKHADVVAFLASVRG